MGKAIYWATKNVAFWGFAFVAMSMLASCAFLSDEQKVLAMEAVEKLVSDGVLTKEQGDALGSSLGGGPWQDVAGNVGTFLGSVVASVFGITWLRGGINNRKGSAPKA